MTHEEAVTRCAQLNRDSDGKQHWFIREMDDGEWELVSVTVEGFRRPDPLKASEAARPQPSEPPDPRPSIVRNIAPFGPG